MIDLYLSEMSVSNGHGGGLTLQRVLGSDLDSLGLFVHVNRFAKKKAPIDKVLPRCVDLPPWLSSDTARRWLGRRISENVPQSRLALRMHARYVARRLRRLVPDGSSVTALVCPQGKQSIVCAEELKKYFKLQYITWIMDDHVVRREGAQWSYPLGFRRTMQRHLTDACAVFVISPAMAQFYKKQFGVKAEVLFSPADPIGEPVWDAPSGRTQPARLAYFGSMDGWQGSGFRRIVEMIPPAMVRIDVFTNAQPDVDLHSHSVSFSSSVCFHQPIPHQNVMLKMREYDALLLPLSFDEQFRHLVELNVATKMSEYLASGTLPLVIGPPYAAMIQFLRSRGAAVVATADKNELLRAVEQVKEPRERRRILTAARKVVLEETSISHMRSRWRRAVERLADDSK